MAFPSSVNNLPANHSAGLPIRAADVNAIETDTNAIGAKVGTGAGAAAANQVLRSTGAGASAWQAPGAPTYATASLPGSPTAGDIAKASDGDRQLRVAGGGGMTWYTVGYGTVNVNEFCKRDGTDETTRFAAAITAAGDNKALYIPAHTSPIIVDTPYPQQGSVILGDGPGRSTLKLKNAATGVSGIKALFYNPDGVNRLTIQGLTLDCNGANQGGVDGRAITLKNGPQQCKLLDLEILNATNTAAITLDGTSTAWSAATNYVAGNQVRYDGVQYVALASSGPGTTVKQPDKYPAVWRVIRTHNVLESIVVPPGSLQALYVSNLSHTYIRRLIVQECSYTGTDGAVNISDAPYTKIVDLVSESNKCHGLAVGSGSNYLEIYNPTLRRNMDQGGGDVRGLTAVGSQRIYVEGGDISGNGENGVLIGNGDDSPYFRIVGTRVRNNWNDRQVPQTTQAGGHGIEMLSHDSAVDSCHVEGNRSGVWMNANRCRVTNSTIVLNYEHGVLSAGGSGQMVKGSSVMNNGLLGTNYDAISLGSGGTGPTDFTIEDCNCGEDSAIGTLGLQRSAVNDSSWAAGTNIRNSRLKAGVFGATTPIIMGNGTGEYTKNLYYNSSGVEIDADPKYAEYARRDLRILISSLPTSGTFLLVSGTGYWIYLGQTIARVTPKFVEFVVTTAGAGTQTAEVGLFSTPNPPGKAAQTLTAIVSTGTVDALTSTGVKRNTSAFATQVPAYTHLWAGIRTAMATTQPTLRGVWDDLSEGQTLALAASGALTAAGPWSGAIPAIQLAAAAAPMLRVTVD